MIAPKSSFTQLFHKKKSQNILAHCRILNCMYVNKIIACYLVVGGTEAKSTVKKEDRSKETVVFWVYAGPFWGSDRAPDGWEW